MLKKLLGFIGLLVLSALPAAAQAPGYHYQSFAFSNGGGQTQILANATITVCQAGASGIPCAPTQPIFSDLGLTLSITNLTSDKNGNFDFYVTPGNDYVITIVSRNGSQTFSYKFTAPCVVAGSACGGGGGGGGTIGGSINTGQIAVGNALNTITGSSAFTFTLSGSTYSQCIGNNSNCIFVTPSTGTIGYGFNDGSNNGAFQIGFPGVAFQVTKTAGVISTSINASGGGGSFIFSNGGMQIAGSTSGTATIGINPIAGSPNRLNIPTTTGCTGCILSTDGGNPQQTSWIPVGVGTVSNQVKNGLPYNSSGTSTVLDAAIPAPTVNGVYPCLYNPTSGVSVPPTCPLAGLVPRGVGASSGSDALLYSDNDGAVLYESSFVGTFNGSLGNPTSLTNQNYFSLLKNFNTAGAPIFWTATGGFTLNGGASYTQPVGQQCSLMVNSLIASDWVLGCSEGPLSVGANMVFTRLPHSLTIATSLTPTFNLVNLNGATAGNTICTQGPLNGHAIFMTITDECPSTVTSSYEYTRPGIGASGSLTATASGGVVTQSYSGDSNRSAVVTTGSGTSIGSTVLCSTVNCPAGTYRVNIYIDITTACGTSGTYVVNLIYTDDQGSKTIPVNINGTGAVPATGVLTTTSTANFGENAQIIRSTGAASINYSTTAVACGSAGPMVGKLYLSTEAIQ